MEDAPAHTRGRRRLGLIAIVCVAVASGVVMQASGWAQTSNYSLVRALHGGTATIDQWHWETKDESWHKGHYYSVKAPILPALTLPVYEVLTRVGGDKWAYEVAMSAREHSSWRWRPTATPQGLYGKNRIRTYHVRDRIEQSTPIIWVLNLFGSVLPALALMLLVRWAAERIEPGYGTATAITLGLATMVLPFSTLYFSHVLAALLAFAAFALLMRERDGPQRLKLLALAGLLSGLAFATEYPLAFAGAALGLYAICRGDRVKRGLVYAGGCIAGSLPLFAYNLAAFGSITHFSYKNAVEKQGRTGHDVLGSNEEGFFGITLPEPKVALELLFSSKGLLTLAPVLAMGIVGTVLLHRRGRRAEALTIAGIAGVYLVYNSGYWLPYGGGTPGPRFLMPVVPFLALPLAIAWRRFPATTLALAVPSALFMLTATLTFPLIGDDHVGFWWKLIDATNFVATVATPLGAGHHWAGIAPVLIAAAVAAGLGAAATGRLPRPRFELRTAAMALVAWAALAATLPWVLGAEQSVIEGDTGAARLIVIFAVAGLLTVAVTALVRARLRAREDAVDDNRPAPLAAEA
jgi:hypothetical protein